MFSPYYARARRRGRGNPYDYCAINVALYGRPRKCWAMTERNRKHFARDSNQFQVGRSGLSWDGDSLTIDLHEVTVPIPSRIRGRIRVFPSFVNNVSFTLDSDRMHRWRPIAPSARVEVSLENPNASWTGNGYIDSNDGDCPLEDSFSGWDWCRAPLADGGAAILYNTIERSGGRSALALNFDQGGSCTEFEPPPVVDLPTTLWRVKRRSRSEDVGETGISETLEDTPFYARTEIRSKLLGERVTAVHESLSLDRFRQPIVQRMLPFRMPRVWW